MPAQSTCHPAPSSTDQLHDWLGESTQLDLSHHRVQITAKRLTQLMPTDRDKMLAIHNWIRRWPYAPIDQSGALLASEIINRKKGGAFTKGVTFVALCRAAGIPARLHIVMGPGSCMSGFLDRPPRRSIFPLAEVHIDGRWLLTDGYVIDPLLWVAARNRLQVEGRRIGYGICVSAPAQWDGAGHHIQQMEPHTVERALLAHDLGVFDDMASFYRLQALIKLPNWLSNARFYRNAQRVARRAQQLREWRPKADSSSVPAWAPTQNPDLEKAANRSKL